MSFRKLTLITLIMALAFSALSVVEASGNTVTLTYSGVFEIEMARNMLPLINQMRTGSDAWYWDSTDTRKLTLTGLKPLRYDYGLEKVAMQRAAELAFYYAHTRPDGSRCFSAYPDYLNGAIGENIAWGYPTTQSMFDGWAEADEPYDGQGHRRNMLSSSFVSVGIACFRYDGSLYWAQEFSSASSTDAESVPPNSVSVVSLESNIDALAIEGGALSLEPGSTRPLSDIQITATSTNNQKVSCVIKDITWSSDNSGIVSISGDTIKGVAKGKATLTGKSGGLTVALPVKVLQMLQSFSVNLSGSFVFNRYGYSPITVEIPGLTQAASYRIKESRLDTSQANYYYDIAAGSQTFYEWNNDENHPVYVTFDVFALDDEDFVIGVDSKNCVVYPSSGVIYLPSDLSAVNAETFQTSSAGAVIVPDGCRSIGSKAFADCDGLCSVRIPGSVSEISNDAFNGCDSDMVIVAPRGSVGQSFAQSKGYAFFEEN